LLLLTSWQYIYSDRTSMSACLHLAAIVLMLGALALQPRVIGIPEPPSAIQCGNHLKQLTLGLHYYHDVYGSFPPAYTVDGQGRPMHSWRALILPFVAYPDLYDYDYDLPWDDPANLQEAHNFMPYCYRCPDHQTKLPGHTSYFAVVGPGTVWPAGQSRSLDEIHDGTSNTMLLIEDHSRSVVWTKPSDVGYDEAIRRLSAAKQPGAHADLHSSRGGTWNNVAFADGHVNLMRQGATPTDLAALLVIDDGREASRNAMQRVTFFNRNESIEAEQERDRRETFQRLMQVIRLMIFLVVAFWPVVWIWREA
jgi:prepilin-type processing-associated H-X9-DG protein